MFRYLPFPVWLRWVWPYSHLSVNLLDKDWLRDGCIIKFWTMKRKGMRARWLQGVFLAVKERTQKETVYICPCWPEWAASNSFCYPALLPDGGWRPQKEVGSAETPASRWSHPTVRGPLRGGKRPNCFCQFEVKILSLESRVIFMDTIKFFLNCLVIWLIKKKINSHLSPQLDYMYLSFFFCIYILFAHCWILCMKDHVCTE